MHEHDIYTGKDLYSKSEFELIRWFGKRTRTLSKARGIDDSEVKASRIRKSVGTERTFSTDINDDKEILQKIWELSRKTSERLTQLQKSGTTVTVKIKTHRFETYSKTKKFERSGK